MHCPGAILTEKNLIGIGGEDFILVVMKFKQQGHDGFVELALQGAFVAQEKIFYQLLAQGTSALYGFSGPDIRQQRPGDTTWRETGMGIKILILHAQERIDKQVRQLLSCENNPVLMVAGMKAADPGRIEPCQ